VKELPQGWVWTVTGEIAEVVGGGTPSTADATNFSVAGVPWLTPADMATQAGKLVFSGARFLSDKGLGASSARLLPSGTVLYTSRAPIGYVGIAANPLATNQGFKSFIPADGILSDFLYYYLEHAHALVVGLASGTTFPELSGRRAAAIPIPVAPTTEQRRIVAEIEQHLSRIDISLAGLIQIRVKVASYVARMFERAVSEAPHTEFRRLLAAPLANGRSVPTADSGFPVLRLTSIRNARVDLAECKTGAWDARQAEPFLVTEGDLLIVRGNGSLHLVGRAGLVQQVSSPVAFPDTLIRAKLDKSAALPAYVARAWHSRIVRRQIEAAARTSAGIYKINQTDIENLRIPLPPRPVQEHLASSADAVESLATQAHAAIERSINMSTRLRQAILHKAFEGKLVPQDSNDEPASVLLDRIRATRAQTPVRRAPRKRLLSVPSLMD
jgi:type I restriction enzyme S subunit